jgi:lysophospholipase L1-like esterase
LQITKKYKGGFSANNARYFKEIISYCKQQKIQLILISSPIFAGGKVDLLNKEDIVLEVDQIAQVNGIKHWNLSSQPYCNQRELFIDHFHMNHKGARLFTEKLAFLYSNNCQKNALNP